ncbi:hypothetical protein [Streptomyces nigra]|uniref:hypothetical protein n=1 Tax=Streptomyces nigra TaxID=1827580 RepID=UPI003644F898
MPSATPFSRTLRHHAGPAFRACRGRPPHDVRAALARDRLGTAAHRLAEYPRRPHRRAGGHSQAAEVRQIEKALTFKGRISDIADDHTEETFRGSYAHGTTLRVIAGQVITTAQQHWLSKALAGPVVLDQEQSLQDPDAEAVLGLSAQDIEQLRAGELDMGVSRCRDPFHFPVRAPGADVPGRPDPLPGMPQCVHPAVQPSSTSAVRRPSGTAASPARPAPLHALWGQSQANLTEVLGLRTNAEISRARQRIADYPRRRFALSDVAAVHATVESGTAVGEVVIDVS